MYKVVTMIIKNKFVVVGLPGYAELGMKIVNEKQYQALTAVGLPAQTLRRYRVTEEDYASLSEDLTNAWETNYAKIFNRCLCN